MVNIKLIFYIALLLNINFSLGIELDILDHDDFKKCHDLNRNDTKDCTSINPSLKLKEDQCWRFTINLDTLQKLKDNYPENWKKIASQMYGFDENLSEEEIREKYVKNTKKNICNLMIGDEDYKNYILYESSRFSVGGKITYNCGDGEKSYKTKDYIPKKLIFKKLKDSIECARQTNETNCYNAASKFLTNDALACWNKVNFYDEKNLGSPDEESCTGHFLSEYKKEFTNTFKFYKGYKKIEETWNCVNKSGKKIQIYMNTITGKLKFT